MNRRVLAGQSKITSSDFAVPDQPGGDELRRVGGYGKTKSLRGQNHSRVHADDLPSGVHQRPSGISGIQRRIGLNNIVHQPAGLRPHRSAQSADNTSGDSLLEAVGTADG